MRRAERLFEIIMILRRRRAPTTAKAIAAELEVAPRTVYRDIKDLQARRVPIDGEAGVGYLLRDGYDLPTLMFSEDQIEALLLGARIVASWADPGLARAAETALAKITAVLPEHLRPRAASLHLLAPPSRRRPEVAIDVASLRAATREARKVALRYTDEQGRHSERVIWPMALAFFPPVWVVLGWCELRQDFRSFRLDRIDAAEILDRRYPPTPGRRLVDLLRREAAAVP